LIILHKYFALIFAQLACSYVVNVFFRITKSIDDALQLSQTYEFSGLDFGHVIIMFVLVVLTILIDSILEDCGVPYGLTEGQDNVYSIEGEATYGHRCQKGPF
jgi:hypothetical protein